MEKLLKKATLEIEKQLEKVGFIDDSDNTERFLDELSKRLAEKQTKEKDHLNIIDVDDFSDHLLDEIKNKIMTKYSKISTLNQCGDYEGYYSSKEFQTIEEFKNYFNLGE